MPTQRHDDQGKSGATNPSARTTVKVIGDRGAYDTDTIYAILDEALLCHVGFVDADQPFVIPTIHIRIGDQLYVHGSPASRMIRRLCDGVAVCITVSILDGLVLARSMFHHSMNYRSVVVLASGTPVTDREHKLDVLKALSDNVIRGRWSEARQPSVKEVNGTAIVGFPLHEASAKIRSGPPTDADSDMALPVWAGVIPVTLTAGAPVPAPDQDPPVAVPAYATEYARS